MLGRGGLPHGTENWQGGGHSPAFPEQTGGTRGQCSWSSLGGPSGGDGGRGAPFLSHAFLSQQSWWLPWVGGRAGGQVRGPREPAAPAG